MTPKTRNALMLAQTALVSSKPTMSHYEDPVARHKAAYDAVVSALATEDVPPFEGTSYTVADKANARLAAQELLITGQEVKVLLDGIV